MSESEAYRGWAVLSLMGHRSRIGIVAEAEMYGGKLLRIDVPSGDAFVTEYYGTSAIYSLTPIAEDVARARYVERDVRPVNPLAYRDPTPEEVEAEARSRARQLSYQRAEEVDDDDMPI